MLKIKHTVDVHLDKGEIVQIIAEYMGVDVKDVVFEYKFNPIDEDEISVRVKKELTFPDKSGQVSVSVGTYNPLGVKTTTPLPSTATEYTGYLPGTYNSPTNISETGTSISEESIRKSIDNIRAKWTKDDALATSETSKANDRK